MADPIKRQVRDDAIVRQCMADVSATAALFERRWTEMALRRIDPDLHRRFVEQRDLYSEALIVADIGEVQDHAAALCRGYQAAVQVMTQADEPDDAYMLGMDVRTGTRCAIGFQKAAVERVAEVHGGRVIWITPDEVAALLAGVEGFKQIATVKQLFPGAEVIDLYPDEPAKGDVAA